MEATYGSDIKTIKLKSLSHLFYETEFYSTVYMHINLCI